MHALVLFVSISTKNVWSAYLHRFQRYDWGPKFLKNGPRDPDHAHPKTNTWYYILPAHKIGDSRSSSYGEIWFATKALENWGKTYPQCEVSIISAFVERITPNYIRTWSQHGVAHKLGKFRINHAKDTLRGDYIPKFRKMCCLWGSHALFIHRWG